MKIKWATMPVTHAWNLVIDDQVAVCVGAFADGSTAIIWVVPGVAFHKYPKSCFKAILGLMHWGREKFGIKTFRAYVDVENVVHRKWIERFGFMPRGTEVNDGKDYIIYESD